MAPAAQATGTQGLVELIDQLEKVLNESELSEIEIEAGGTALVLRKPIALAAAVQSAAPGYESAAGGQSGPSEGRAQAADEGPPPNAVLAPLTGLFYRSPSPGAEPYLREGGPVMVGQVIGLIEAMKLFNEIKSDRAGRVTRIYPESGALVKAKQPLIEVEP
jgi:acetyl-CoA carboxylase biotin carboxyl carrier protein